MSLCINTITSEGMVLAADSRQTYKNRKGMSRIGSDSASKIFQLTDTVGIAITGLAFLSERGTLKNISSFIENFKTTHDLKKSNVEEIAKKLKNYFEKKYDYKPTLKQLSKNIKVDLESRQFELLELEVDEKIGRIEFKFKDKEGKINTGAAGIDGLQFIVTGFNMDDSYQSILVYIPGEIKVQRDSTKKGKQYGAGWIGQTDVVTRMILGFDGRISNLPFVQKSIKSEGGEIINSQLRKLEYDIKWGTMTLQDGIDFSLLAIETTSAIQRFSDGIMADPGDMPGVGGPIDVAVITKDKGFIWVKKKGLIVKNNKVDLESIKDLK
ncbi:MAG: hypothetical protein WDZ80_05575 [Candidatus Paceibacterota bacterium]